MPRADTVAVFAHGEGGYPCIRIPSVINAGKQGSLIAFAECRYVTGDGCYPASLPLATPDGNVTHDICSKRSSDNGATWSSLAVVAHDAAQPQAHQHSCKHMAQPSRV